MASFVILGRVEDSRPRLWVIGTLALLLGTSPAAAVTYIQGIDVYYGDGTVNWVTAKNAGIQFAYVKATDGVDDIDSKFALNMQGAQSAGVLVGPYHICRVASRYIDSSHIITYTSYDGLPFPVNSDPWLDATSEAADFIQAIRPYYNSGSYLPPVADVETSIIEQLPFSTANQKAFVSNWLQLFSDSVNNALGVRPMIYTSKSSANTYYSSSIAANHKLWEAWWKDSTTSPPVPSDTPGWQPWSFWQYSALGDIPGVPGSNGDPPTYNYDREDVDVFYGTMAQLTALLVHTVPGDYNHNGVVDAADYVVWRKTQSSTVNLAADGTNNELVNTNDYTYWRARVGQSAGSGSELGESAVPEPSGGLLVLIGVAAFIAARLRYSRLPSA